MFISIATIFKNRKVSMFNVGTSTRSKNVVTVRENEEVFRAILRDLKLNREIRPMGMFFPDDFDTEMPFDEIVAKYLTETGFQKFVISGFEIKDKSALFTFQNMSLMSGGGAMLHYQINDDGSVTFLDAPMTMRS